MSDQTDKFELGFDAKGAISKYRETITELEAADTESARGELRFIAERLRKRWMRWQGVDSLHETAFSELRE